MPGRRIHVVAAESIGGHLAHAHTRRYARIAGRTLRTRLRRGIEDYATALFKDHPEARLGVLAPRSLLGWLYGSWDPKFAAAQAVRMSIGSAPRAASPMVVVQYLHRVYRSTHSWGFDAVLILAPAYPPRPTETADPRLWRAREEQEFAQTVAWLRQRDQDGAPPELVLWGTGKTEAQVRSWGHTDVTSHPSMTTLLEARGQGSRRRGRGMAPSSRLLVVAAPERPFSINDLVCRLERILRCRDHALLALAAGFESLADGDFDKGVLRSVRQDHGLDRLGRIQGADTLLRRNSHLLSKAARACLERTKATLREVLATERYPGGFRTHPEDVREIARIARRRRQRLAATCVRSLVLELLVRCEPLPGGRWHRRIHRALDAAGFVRRGDLYSRPYPARTDTD